MSLEDEAKDLLLKLGMWWPDGDSGTLRTAAGAWRTFAKAVDDVRAPVDNAAQAIIHHNRGEAIETFEKFWARYAKGKDAGWLSDLSESARNMAHALDTLADAIDDAVNKLWTQIGIDAAVIAGGIALAFVTAGLASAASAAAAEAIIELGTTLGIAVSTTVADIAATTLAAAVFGGLESVTVDVAVAQPLKIASGMQTGMSLDEINQTAKDGILYGAAFGAGFGVLKPGANPALAHSPFLAHPPSLRPNLVELGPAARQAEKTPCVGEPVDVATGAMLMTQTDLTLPAAGLPLLFQRTHLSSYRAGLCFGPRWVSTLDECVQIDGEGVVFAAADGMRLVYPVPRPDVPVLPAKGARWPLEWDGKPDGVMTITDPSTGVVRTFTTPIPSGTTGLFRLPLESWHDRNGMRIDVERTDQGIPTAVRHSGGYYLAIDTTGHRITALRLLDEAPSAYDRHDPAVAAAAGTVVMRYGYDEAGRLTDVINSSGQPLRFTYDGEDRVTSWTDRNGTSFTYTYDAHGRVVRTEGSDGFLSGTLTYDEQTRTTTYTDSLGHTSRHRYNAEGQVIEETDPLGHITGTEWDEYGDKPVAVTDPLGHTTRYVYDEAGNLSQLTRPDGSVVRATYNTLNQPTQVVEPGGATWEHAYDDRGNLLTTVDPLGAETHFTYDAAGHLTTVTDAHGHSRRATTDAAGLPLAVTDELGRTTTVLRDTFGRITEVTDPLGHVTLLGWTAAGQPEWREYPDGARESWTWDSEGNLRSHTDPAGLTTHYTVAPFDVQATRTAPDGATYTFSYDTELHLTGVTNPQGLTWAYTYDSAGRLTTETDFNGRTLTYTHDAAGRLVCRSNGAGQALHYTRDTLGRITEQSSGDDSAVTTYAYNASGELIHTANADAEISFERDVLGRVLVETVNGRTTTYTYDLLGRRTQRTTPTGLTSTWSYDPTGRPSGLYASAGSLAFGYDAAGRETERRLGDHVTLTQSWDKSNRLTMQSVTHHAPPPSTGTNASLPAAGRLLQHRAFTYRPDDHLTEIRDLTSGTRRFTLDAMGRTTGVSAHGWSETYAYDTTGNLVEAAVPGHESPGEREFAGTLIRRAGRTSYVHDEQGRLVGKTRNLLNGQKRTWTYSWNAEDRLTKVITPDGARWHYAYDPLGRRVSKYRLAPDGTKADRTDFCWDDTRLAEQTGPDGRATTWDYTPDTHRPLTQTNHTPPTVAADASFLARLAEESDPGRVSNFHAVITDPIGTPTELVSDSGELIWQRRTTLWGTRLPGPGSEGGSIDCPLRFPGQYADSETGLNYNYARYYDPEAARYICPDPLGLEPAPNHHVYVPNPLGWDDTLGLAPRGPKNPLQFGQGYTGRVDTWPEGTKGTDFEIHVYDKSMREVGVFRSDGWFNKHGHTGADVEVPPSVENAIKGRAVDTMRKIGRIGPKGTEDISGDKWRRPPLSAEGCK